VAEKRLCSDAPGFTLIELMIVLVIMGLVLAFAAPRIASNLLGLSLDTTAKKVAGALRYARSQALTTGRIYNAIFDCENGRMIIVEAWKPSAAEEYAAEIAAEAADDAQEQGTASEILNRQRQQPKTYELPEEIRFGAVTIGDAVCNDDNGKDICQMAFFPDGTSQGGEIILTDTKERIYSIDINLLTGIVSLEEQTEE
jgi:type II secretion system protein H